MSPPVALSAPRIASAPTEQFSPTKTIIESKITEHVEDSTEADLSKLTVLDDLLTFRAKATPSLPLVAYPATPSGIADYVHYDSADLDRFAEEAAWAYLNLGIPMQDLASSTTNVVSLLAPSNIDYVAAIFGLSRLGYAILVLSTRLSPEAIQKLLIETKSRIVISTPFFSKIIAEVSNVVPGLKYVELLDQSQYDLPLPTHERLRIPVPSSAANRTALIAHSSGSTGLPKPIFMSHSSCLYNFSQNFNMRSFNTLPLYHNHGISSFFRAIFSGKEIFYFNPFLPMTSNSLSKAIAAVKPDLFSGVPYGLKLLVEGAEQDGGLGMEALRNCKIVLFGGSSCPDDLGDKLVLEYGVNVVSHYGSTETGQLMTSFREMGDNAWNYVRVSSKLKPYLVMEPVPRSDSGLDIDAYEAVVLDGWKSKVVSNSSNPAPNCFRTRDLFIPHPTIPDAWKYLQRLDDRVTLVMGEKVLPLPIEHRIRQHPLVKECVVVGVGRSTPGLLIFPAQQVLDPVAFVEDVWPAVVDANSRAEGFSQIAKDMIAVLAHDADYPRTAKDTIIRGGVYMQFAAEIDALYSAFEGQSAATQSSGDSRNESALLQLDLCQLEDYLVKLLSSITGAPFQDKEADFYLSGVDSLQAIRVWSSLKKELDLGSRQKSLSQNIAYEQANISELAKFLYNLRVNASDNRVDEKLQDEEAETTAMRQLMDKYCTGFVQHTPGPARPIGQNVLITGTTGSLGAHILSQLIRFPHVNRVYCLVRAKSPLTALSRVIRSLNERKLDSLAAEHISKIVAIPCDLSRKDLGIEPFILSQMLGKHRNGEYAVTSIIHSAWAVNFNLRVRSFERDHIGGWHNLLNFALSLRTAKPARAFFCSSVSIGAGTRPLPATVPETILEDVHQAQNMGYARSKFVAEHVTRASVTQAGLEARVCRIGQIVGDTELGIWNDIEAIPMMIRSAVTMGALPALKETPTWFPVDLTARAIVELAGLDHALEDAPASTVDVNRVYHVLNHNLFSWTNALLPALAACSQLPKFRVVPVAEWLELLQAPENEDAERNPTVKLKGFFTGKYSGGEGQVGREGLFFDTRETAADNRTVAEGYDIIGQGLVEKMVASWMKTWGSGST